MAGPGADAAMIRKILVAIDDSEHALRVARLAADVALRYDADLHLVQVVPQLVVSKQLEEFAAVEKIDVPDVPRRPAGRLFRRALGPDQLTREITREA
jgi:nucleotide-binding universal stress UspA family protein